MGADPILAIPPFPGAKVQQLSVPGDGDVDHDDISHDQSLLTALAQHRVGGQYWGSQPDIPPHEFTLDGTTAPASDAVLWRPEHDPWHILERAEHARLPTGDARALLAIAAGVPLTLVEPDGSVRIPDRSDIARMIAAHLTSPQWINPFDGGVMSAQDAIALCGFWRRLIDANRRIHTVLGIAYWKKPTMTALLWAGGPVPYGRTVSDLPKGAAVAIWRSRLSQAEARAIEDGACEITEIEDGFIRSSGLGSDCVPPLSINIDSLGPHFAPGAPSELEQIIENESFPAELVERAKSLRQTIIANGLSKYETGTRVPLERPGGDRRHILVPGQVEDDRAVTSGGALSSNLELLRRARAEAGAQAYVIYKPHPDVLAGHRRGHISNKEVAELADQVEVSAPIAELIAMVDELHVNSSLAGFEALLRGKAVTVHGVPFYAGWGLTRDRGAIPKRRTARRTLDELVAAALILYPRYYDPETGLPCPAETLVDRLVAKPIELDRKARTIIAARRAVGRFNRVFKS